MNSHSFTVLFAATPEIAIPVLDFLAQQNESELQLKLLVLTNPDAPSGRGAKLTPSPIKTRALELGLTIFQPEKLDSNFRAILQPYNPDLLISFAYGKIFGPVFLGLFSQGGVNLHPSLLPRWRGPSPLNAAILSRDTETGITLQHLAKGMDEGAIISQRQVALIGMETTESLGKWAAVTAVDLLYEFFQQIKKTRSLPAGTPQSDTGVSYCSLVNKMDALINWNLSAIEIDAKIRAYTPWPWAWTTWKTQVLQIRKAKIRLGEAQGSPGQVIAVDKSEGILVQTNDGFLVLQELQLAGKKTLDFRSFLNGARDFLGSSLGDKVL